MTSNQFPIQRKPKPTVGSLYYNGKVMLSRLPFWKLQQERKDLIRMGYAREKFRISYILVIVILFCLPINGQDRLNVFPRMEIAYNISDRLSINNPTGVGYHCDLPHGYASAGIGFKWREMKVTFDNSAWFGLGREGIGFTPSQMQYRFEVGFRGFGILHECWHPVLSAGRNGNGVYGGTTRVFYRIGY